MQDQGPTALNTLSGVEEGMELMRGHGLGRWIHDIGHSNLFHLQGRSRKVQSMMGLLLPM